MAAGCLILAVVPAQATPIRPDIRKIVYEPQQDSTSQWVPARAGWDGPEMARSQTPALSASFAAMSGREQERARLAELISVATPDPRAVLGIAALIFLLRLLRKQDEKRAGATAFSSPLPPDDESMAA